jgi:hypothetical protein
MIHDDLFRKKCVCVSGFVTPGGLARAVFGSGGYETGTVHVLGKADVVVVRERSEGLGWVGMCGWLNIWEGTLNLFRRNWIGEGY